MSVIEEAVASYHEILRRDPGNAPAMLDAIYADQVQRKVVYAEKPIPTVMRPHFIDRPQVALLERAVSTIVDCLERVVHLYCEDPEVRDRIPFEAEHQDLLCQESGLERNVIIARLDSFLEGDRLHFIEFNTDSPASIIWNEVHQDVFETVPALQELGESFEISRERQARTFFEAMMATYEDFGLAEAPRMLVVDWDHVQTRPEFELTCEYFERWGMPCRIADPRELEFRDGALWAGDFKANFVNRRVILRELSEKRKDCAPLLEAARSGRICFANPFRSKIAGNKGVLAFLTDSRNAGHFTAEERAVIDAHLPWTCVLNHEARGFRGDARDPFDVAREHKAEMVIKPLNDYGGRGVLLGAEASSVAWEQALEGAEPGGWCLQERVVIPEAEFPVIEEGLRFEPRKINLNPFALRGRYAGCLTRISVRPVINVTAGGGMVPTFTLGGRRS